MWTGWFAAMETETINVLLKKVSFRFELLNCIPAFWFSPINLVTFLKIGAVPGTVDSQTEYLPSPKKKFCLANTPSSPIMYQNSFCCKSEDEIFISHENDSFGRPTVGTWRNEV